MATCTNWTNEYNCKLPGRDRSCEMTNKNNPNSKEQNRRNKKLEEKRTILRAFETPNIRIESKLANKSFVAVVKSVIEKIDLFDEKYFPPYVQDYFRNLKQRGTEVAIALAIPHMNESIEEQAMKNQSLSSTVTIDPLYFLAKGLGQVIMDRIDEVNEELFPMNDVEVHFFENEIVLALSSMLQRNAGGKEIFHSRNRLQVEVDSKKYILAFDKHTIDAICNRFRPDFLCYGGLGDAHALFSYLNFVDIVRLPKGNLAVSIFDFCFGPGTWQYDNYVGRCLPGVAPRGPDNWKETGKPYGYRIGYCPVDLIDGYAITRTFLLPGFAKTPERQCLKLKCSDSKEKYRLTRIAQNMRSNTLRLGKGFDAIEWFHRNGVPQVIDPPVPLFDEEYQMRKLGLA